MENARLVAPSTPQPAFRRFRCAQRAILTTRRLDREALLRWGRPIRTDRYVSMSHGPVLIRTLGLITEGRQPGVASRWAERISEPLGRDVELKLSPPPDDELSPAEEDLIDVIFARFGSLNRWQIGRHLHDLPEWHDPKAGSVPIDHSDILRPGRRAPRKLRPSKPISKV
ncbi:MAG: SocA family protein [Acidobacteria bacterium]|nr:SocA family protein [Acidobacteriota bacterium]